MDMSRPLVHKFLCFPCFIASLFILSSILRNLRFHHPYNSITNNIPIDDLMIRLLTAMETTTTTDEKKSLIKSNSSVANSFRLRSSSLNSVRLRRIFDLFDTDHDSFISVDELSRALVLLGLETDVSELDSMIKSYIQPGNTGLTFEDFESLHKSLGDLFFEDCVGDEEEAANGDKSNQEEADLTEAFKVFDEDGDGFISAKELQVVLEKLGFAEASEMGRVEMMISSVDRNADGVVDFSEFKEMMKNVNALKG